MKAVLADTKIMKDSVKLISDLVTEAQLSFSKEGMHMEAMDPANVAMILFKLNSGVFTEYDISQDFKIAVNFDRLKSVFNRSGESDILILECLEKKAKKLSITIKGERKRTFNIGLISDFDKVDKVPSLEPTIEFKLNSDAFSETVDDASLIGDTVLMKINNTLKFFADDSVNNCEIEYPESLELKKLKEASQNISCKYSLDYLRKMAQAKKISGSLILRAGKDYPLLLKYEVVDKYDLSFILAPRVEND